MVNTIGTNEEASAFISSVLEQDTAASQGIQAIIMYCSKFNKAGKTKSCELLCKAAIAFLKQQLPTIHNYDFLQSRLSEFLWLSLCNSERYRETAVIAAQEGIPFARNAIRSETCTPLERYMAKGIFIRLTKGIMNAKLDHILQEEKKLLLDEAMELVNMDEADLGHNIDIIRAYVTFCVDYEGSSPRLEKLARKQLEMIQNHDGPDSGEIEGKAIAFLVCYLLYTNQFSEAIKFAQKNVDIVENCPGMDQENAYIAYENLMFAFWGNRDWKQAIGMCKKAYKIAKKWRQKDLIATCKKHEKAIRKKRKYPKKKAKEAEVGISKEEYRKIRHILQLRQCAYCGEIEGKLWSCAACENVWYCSKDHQQRDWKKHKQHCKEAKKAKQMKQN